MRSVLETADFFSFRYAFCATGDLKLSEKNNFFFSKDMKLTFFFFGWEKKKQQNHILQRIMKKKAEDRITLLFYHLNSIKLLGQEMLSSARNRAVWILSQKCEPVFFPFISFSAFL